ncbi:thioredoxin-like 3-1, chloroplastic isoform X4 [Mercurialis annua]|uniref:thioredoxin-like 3-1, chloroplastic isoform X4 n=1 Tax=Mercurialis annua TaxID=3986 RepID=UPI002160A844|nr:thioredoxin-like 3-1, chloroplastic isoform X4 [Mercurialis annua]
MSSLAANSQVLYRNQLWSSNSGMLLLEQRNFISFGSFNDNNKKITKRRETVRVEAFWADTTRPASIEMEPINDSDQLDQILLNAQQISHPILIDWVKFYSVDVNKVPQSLVKRGNISLWKDGEMKEEVIGGHKAWLVIEEVRAMIQKHI